MIEYIITFQKSEQITEDHWVVVNPSMKVTNETTIGEIADFFHKHLQHSSVEVKLIELTK